MVIRQILDNKISNIIYMVNYNLLLNILNPSSQKLAAVIVLCAYDNVTVGWKCNKKL